MKKFTLKLLLFCAIPMVLLMPLAYFVDKGLRQSKHFLFAEWNDIFNGNINADMLIMGSSRAWVHFSPYILDSTLKVNSYNLGMDGASINLQLPRLKIYLQHNKAPKYILLEVGLHSAVSCTKNLPQYAQLLPYLNDTTIWAIYREQYEGAALAERYFPMFKYNNQLPLIKEGLQALRGKGMAASKYKGYQGQERAWDHKFEAYAAAHPKGSPIDIMDEAVASLRAYVRLCQENNIELIMVYAPFYYEVARYITNMDEVSSLLDGIATTNKIPLLDYTNNYIDSNKHYFYNSQHLNKEGSELFTHMLAKDLKSYIEADSSAD